MIWVGEGRDGGSLVYGSPGLGDDDDDLELKLTNECRYSDATIWRRSMPRGR